MDLSGEPNCGVLSQPSLKDSMEKLLKVCKKLSKADLKKLMSLSDAIAQKDYERYQQWEKLNCKAAALAMDGPAYRGFDAKSLSDAQRKDAQSKVRILSGLYGALKPFDAIRPYRLEMGSALKNEKGANLYSFWGDTIAKHIGKGAKVIVNAASQEYWKAVKVEALGVPVVTMDFPGPAVFAKKARGLICRFAVQNKCTKAEDLKKFKGAPGDLYAFDAKKSTDTKYVFQRVQGGAAKAKAKSKPTPAAKAGATKRTASAAAGDKPKRARKS